MLTWAYPNIFDQAAVDDAKQNILNSISIISYFADTHRPQDVISEVLVAYSNFP